MRRPLPPDEPDTACADTGTRSPARSMLAILATVAMAVLIWPGLLHSARLTGVKSPAAAPLAQVSSPVTTASPVRSLTSGSWLPTESNWGEQLRSGDYWAKHAFNGGNWSQPRNGLTKADRVSIPWPEMRRLPEGSDFQGLDRGGGKTYRTMCVRLCDGYYWPVSYSVTKDKFEGDADSCARSCGGADQAKLFVYRNPGSEIDDMEDLDGRAYKKLKTAFLFKTKYEASCKCRPDPWDQASSDRHKSYALAEQAQQGNKFAAAQLQELKSKLRDDEKAAAKSKAAQSKSQKSASLAPSKRASDAATDDTAPGPKATIAASVAKPNVIRGSDRQGGQLRSVRKQEAESVDADDEDAPRAVRLRLGNRPSVDVPVRSTTRTRKAAEASSSRVWKQ